MIMQEIFKVGDVLTGYCNGYFGRDDYYDKVCALVTSKYAVFEGEDDCASVLNNPSVELYNDSREWIEGEK